VSRFSVLAHLVWEGVLLVAALVVTMLGVAEGHVFTGPGPWSQVAIVGMLAAGLALSLRTGTPNLAVASIASVSGLLYAVLITDGWPIAPAALLAVLAALGFGAVLAVLVGLTGAPAWAVSLGGVAVASTIGLANGLMPRYIPQGLITNGWLTGFAALFVVGSVAGGALWLVPGVRAGLRAPAVNGAPAPAVGRRLLAALVGLGGSSLLAGLAGVLGTGRLTVAVFTGTDSSLLFALGAVLLGGVSLTGRGGGVAGTALGAYLLVIVRQVLLVDGDRSWAAMALPATVAVLLGLVVSRVLDLFGTRSGPASGRGAPVPYMPGGYPHLAYPFAGYPQPAYPTTGDIPAPRGPAAPSPAQAPAEAPTQPAAPAEPGTEPPPGG
jgi:ribose/xylose/arabinose/galactoside ABC-type transport system permease subunit